MSDQLENESYFRSRFVSQPMLEEIQESSRQGLSFIKWKKKRLKMHTKRAACWEKAATSCLFALFDKPISRLRAFLHAVRKTNQNSCLCPPVVSVLFADSILKQNDGRVFHIASSTQIKTFSPSKPFYVKVHRMNLSPALLFKPLGLIKSGDNNTKPVINLMTYS